MGFGTRTRIRCPVCNSYRVEGTPKEFKCKNCGFKHQENKPDSKLLVSNALEAKKQMHGSDNLFSENNVKRVVAKFESCKYKKKSGCTKLYLLGHNFESGHAIVAHCDPCEIYERREQK